MGSRTGIFITLEGGEGSGKTTQTRKLVGYLESRGLEVLLTREPGGTKAGEAIRELLLHRLAELSPQAELALYLASRAELTREVIRPNLERGVCVVCDRFADSSTAYQGGGRDLGIEFVEKMNDWATGALQPDLTLYFDVDPRDGLARAEEHAGGAKGLDRIEREGLSFHERVRAAYRVVAGRHPGRFRAIPTHGGEEEVWKRVRAVLDGRLVEKGVRP